MQVQPPKWADRFLAWYCNPELLEEIQGDARELYFQRIRSEGKLSADFKYIWDIIRFCRWSNIRQSNNHYNPGYFRILWNLNLKISLRNALQNKFVFSIKIFGLSVCLAFAFVVSAFVIQEFSYDKYHQEHERIFRIGSKVEIGGNVTDYGVSPLALAEAISEEIPDVAYAFRCMYGGRPVYTIEGKSFNNESTLIVEADFLSVFSFHFIRGDIKALEEPNKIVLTESTAARFFGTADPMGQIIDLPWTQLEVAAVIRDVPVNTHLRFDVLTSWDTYDFDEAWDNINAYTYVQLKNGSDVSEFPPKVNSVLKNHLRDIEANVEFSASDNLKIEPIIDNVADIHLSEYRDEDIAHKRNYSNIYILIVVVVLFFANGLINYVNLSLAEQTKNLRRLGILQVFGGASADDSKVILTNIILTIFFLLPLSSILVVLSLLLADSYIDIYIDPNVFLSLPFLAIAVGSLLMFIFSSRINSIILLRSANIINALKGKINSKQNGFQLREYLVSIQLSFSIVMIAIIAIIFDQFQFINTIDKGFEDKNTIVVKMRSGHFSTAQVFQESLRSLNGINKVDGSSFYFDNIEKRELFEIETDEGKKKMLVAYMNCGFEFLDALEIQLVKGRNFMKERSSDNFGAYVINETAAKAFGWKDPIGKRIWGPVDSDRTEGEVVGVVRDFNFASLHNEIEPLIIFPVAEGWGVEFVYVKLDPVRPPDVVSKIEEQYNEIYPDLPFEWEYLDSKYQSLYREDMEIKNIFQVGLIISIFVSSLGIFSISAFMAIMRAKEMGIRKVVGANALQLFALHLQRFIRFILISFLIASPAIYYLSQHWLNNFAYHIELTSWYFVVPCLIALIIVFVTSGYHGMKSSQVNPVDILKEE